GGWHDQTNSHPYDDALARARIAARRGEFKAILWHQGESDANAERAPLYGERLVRLSNGSVVTWAPRTSLSWSGGWGVSTVCPGRRIAWSWTAFTGRSPPSSTTSSSSRQTGWVTRVMVFTSMPPRHAS